MARKHNLWLGLLLIIHLFNVYFVMCFCGVMENSSMSWVYGSIISIITDITLIELAIIFFKALSREWIRRYPSNRNVKIYKIGVNSSDYLCC